MEEEKKFSTAEVIIGGLFALFIDGMALLLDLIPAIGWLIATVVQAMASVGTTLWLVFKGSKRATKLERQLVKQLSNFLPFVPTVFASFMIEVALHNNPRLQHIAKKIKT